MGVLLQSILENSGFMGSTLLPNWKEVGNSRRMGMAGELSLVVETVPPTRLRNRLVPNGMPVNCGVRGTG